MGPMFVHYPYINKKMIERSLEIKYGRHVFTKARSDARKETCDLYKLLQRIR